MLVTRKAAGTKSFQLWLTYSNFTTGTFRKKLFNLKHQHENCNLYIKIVFVLSDMVGGEGLVILFRLWGVALKVVICSGVWSQYKQFYSLQRQETREHWVLPGWTLVCWEKSLLSLPQESVSSACLSVPSGLLPDQLLFSLILLNVPCITNLMGPTPIGPLKR